MHTWACTLKLYMCVYYNKYTKGFIIFYFSFMNIHDSYISHHAHTNTMSFGGHNLLSLVLSTYASVREYSLEYEKPNSGHILKERLLPPALANIHCQ